jgi:hypothetical protein
LDSAAKTTQCTPSWSNWNNRWTKHWLIHLRLFFKCWQDSIIKPMLVSIRMIESFTTEISIRFGSSKVWQDRGPWIDHWIMVTTFSMKHLDSI